MKFEFFLAKKFLLSKKTNKFISLITFISIVGVMIGVCALIVVLSVMEGLESDLKNKIIGNTAHISVYKIGSANIYEHNELIKEISSIPGVRGVSPAIYKEAMLLSKLGISSGIIAKGIDPDSYNNLNNFTKTINKSLNKQLGLNILKIQEGLPGLIIGEELAKDLLLSLGDEVTILSPLGEITPFGNQPKLKNFRVMAIFDSGYWEFDSKFVYLNLKEAQKFWNMNDSVHLIEIGTFDLAQTKKISNLITDKISPIFYTKDWRISHKSLFNALRLEKTVMFLILTMIVIVACFNIIATLIMIVIEKSKDIAILKAIGTKTKSIIRIFTIVGMAIGITGTFLGLASGLILSYLLKYYIKYPLNPEVYFTDTLPVKVDITNVGIVILASFIISYLSTLYPSYRAGKLDPIVHLRYE